MTCVFALDSEVEGSSALLLQVPTAEVRITPRLGGTPREIALGDALFVSEEHSAVEQFADYLGQGQSASMLHNIESKLRYVFVAVAMTALFAYWFVTTGMPASAKWLAFNLPSISSEYMGGTLALLDETHLEPSALDEARQQHIQDLVEPYRLQHEHLNAQLHFRSGMAANALAMPGGDIVFTDDFVKLVQADQELVAVYFHELGHLQHKHMTRRLIQGSMLTVALLMITGDIDSFDLLTGIPTLLLDLSYSREFEVEADSYALEQMHIAEIPLEHFSTVMQRLEDYYQEKDSANEADAPSESGDKPSSEPLFSLPSFLSTHPATHERIKHSHRMIEQYQQKRD